MLTLNCKHLATLPRLCQTSIARFLASDTSVLETWYKFSSGLHSLYPKNRTENSTARWLDADTSGMATMHRTESHPKQRFSASGARQPTALNISRNISKTKRHKNILQLCVKCVRVPHPCVSRDRRDYCRADANHPTYPSTERRPANKNLLYSQGWAFVWAQRRITAFQGLQVRKSYN